MDRDLARRRALSAERLSASDPLRSRALAEAARVEGQESGDPLAVVIALRAMGLACRELNNLASARRYLLAAIKLAEDNGLASEAATTRGRLAYVTSLGGNTTEALADLDRTDAASTGLTRAELQMQRALVLQRTGKSEEALDLYRRAIPELRRAGALVDEARARSNRAVLYTYRGNFAAAEADLQRAAELAPAADGGVALAKIHHNLGFVAACRGNVPEALSWFDQAQEEFNALGQPESPVLADRCEVLLSVGLAAEGLEAAQRVVFELENNGGALDLAEARLMAARAALLTEDVNDAISSAQQALSEFRRQERPGWACLAEYVILRARIEQGATVKVGDIDRVAERLATAGWRLSSVELRLSWATRCLDGPNRQRALEQLRIVAIARRQSPATVRGRGWYAEAIVRHAMGDVSGCRTALRTGLRILEQHHAAFGATELQAHAANNAKDLAAFGCEIALDEKQPAVVLEWAERWRAGTLRTRPVHAPKDRKVQSLLGELRLANSEMEQAALEGRPTHRILSRLANLEATIRDHTRTVPGAGPGSLSSTPGPPRVRQLREELGDQTLVEFLAVGNELHAVTVTEKRARLFRLGDRNEVRREIDSLRFSYGRLARGRGNPKTVETFTAAAQYASNRLQELLFDPLDEELGDGPLIVVPTGRLHHLPWAGLRSCEARVVSVVPSAALWMDVHRRRQSRGKQRVCLVAGPGLPFASKEIENLRALYPDATVLVGRDATTERVATALDGAHLAHVAAHGIFRADNPLFSSLQLHDGRLTVHDLDQLRRAPQTLVLSACESGINAVQPGDELLGLSAAVLSLGTSHLVASVVPVPDETTASFMVDLHHHLAEREPPPLALAHARGEPRVSGQAEMVTTAGFVCFGA